MFTWRIHMDIHPETKKLLENSNTLLLAHWHGHELALIHLVKKLKIATITSSSKDSQIVAGVIRKLGGQSSKALHQNLEFVDC